MSRYMINKLIRDIEMSDANVNAYVANPSGYVDSWLAGGSGSAAAGAGAGAAVGSGGTVGAGGGRHDRTDDRLLTEAERAAFSARDFGTLYALGAHPYLLWHWVEAVFIHEEEWRPLVERYRAIVTPLGYPDFIV